MLGVNGIKLPCFNFLFHATETGKLHYSDNSRQYELTYLPGDDCPVKSLVSPRTELTHELS